MSDGDLEPQEKAANTVPDRKRCLLCGREEGEPCEQRLRTYDHYPCPMVPWKS
ncbi:MAG: hypothetical protein KIT00_00110 [Rhodospirillales bacterium]|nr:hypothetical protein [Rhodospirillales bacterium]